MNIVYMVTFFDDDDDSRYLGLYSNFKKACDAADRFIADNGLTIDEVWSYDTTRMRHIELENGCFISIEPCEVQ